jgi:hypothetical protein
MGLRRAIETNGTFDPALRFAIMLTVANVDRCEYGEALNTMLARSAGWADADIELLRAGAYLGLTRFVDDFVAYALTEFDVPATRDAASSTRSAN